MQAIQGILIIGIIFTHTASATSSQLKCGVTKTNIEATGWKSMVNSCTELMRNQVNQELTAAMTYMSMGAHFAKDSINRPGFSKMFFESASEEREHAIKIIEYLLMRGELTSEVAKLIKNPKPVGGPAWDSGLVALQKALVLEVDVTKNILAIIKACENDTVFNDFHLVDYLTGDFLEEQYKGQRDLAGKISTLQKMMTSHEALGEFLFDKKLLNGQPL